jgi:hypothetical protein
MDPIAAIGVAAAIVGFVDFGLKLFSQADKMRGGSGKKTAQMVAADMIKFVKSLEASRVLASMRGSSDWSDYETLLDECTVISDEILKALNKMTDGKARGQFYPIHFRIALLSNRSDKHVETLLERLQRVRGQVIL